MSYTQRLPRELHIEKIKNAKNGSNSSNSKSLKIRKSQDHSENIDFYTNDCRKLMFWTYFYLCVRSKSLGNAVRWVINKANDFQNEDWNGKFLCSLYFFCYRYILIVKRHLILLPSNIVNEHESDKNVSEKWNMPHTRTVIPVWVLRLEKKCYSLETIFRMQIIWYSHYWSRQG